MAKVMINGVPPFNGDYELDLSFFTNRELHTIKVIAGVRAGEFEAAMEAGDNDLMVAMTVIAVKRAGKQIPVDALWDAAAGTIEFDFSDEAPEADALPLDPKPTPSASG